MLQHGFVVEQKFDVILCVGAGVRPQLLVANRFDIRTLQVDTWWEQTVLEDLVSAVAVDFDYNDALIFWTDLSEERIFRY